MQTAGKQILFACRDVALDPPAQLVVAAEVGELAQLLVELRPDWREALDLYVLYHRLELWDWLASLGQTDALDALADEMRLLTV